MNVEIPDENSIRERATELSQGNIYLKNALISLWRAKIAVLECDKGNVSEGIYPNISLLVNENSANLVKKIYDLIFNLFNDNAQINFLNYKEKDATSYIMNVSVKYNYANALFALFITYFSNNRIIENNKIYLLLNKDEKIEIQENEIVSYIMQLIVFCSRARKNVGVSVSNKKMILKISDDNGEYNDRHNLSECLEEIKNSKTMEYGIYECDNDSTRKLVEIMQENSKGHQKRK